MADFRLFFALWPEEVIRTKVAAIARSLPRGGPRAYSVNPDRYHITLLYLGEADHAQTEAAKRAAAEVHGAPFALQLDRLGAFPRARVWWLGAKRPPAQFQALGAALRAAAQRAGLRFDPRPLRPHVSLQRETAGMLPPGSPVAVRWEVRDFALVNSVLSPKTARYEVLQRWPLNLQEITGEAQAPGETMGK